MKYIKRSMNPISINDIVKWIAKGKPISSKAVVVTFDDNYEDNYTFAYPILKRLEIPATIFLSTGYIETCRVYWWEKVIDIIWKSNESIIKLENFQEFPTKIITSLFHRNDPLKKCFPSFN